MTIKNATLPQLADPGQITQVPLTGYELVEVDAGPEFTNNVVHAVADTRLSDQTVTATGSNRGGAYAIVAQLTNVTTTAASTGVVLPTATKPGMKRTIINNGANTLTVYASGSDTIDGTAGATGVSLIAGNAADFNCVDNAKWISIQDTGIAGGVLSGANGGTGVANTGDTITLGGNFATTGAFNTTLAQTATGTYTLPTPGGTLASTTGANLFQTDVFRSSSTNTSTGNTTLTNIVGLVGTVVTGGTYRFRAVLPGVADGTGGIKYAFKLTTTALTSIEATGMGFTASAVAVQHTTTTTDQTLLFDQAAAVIMTVLEGTFVVTTGGTMQLQAGLHANSGSSTVLVGSSLEFCRIA